jgi:hypothetical protein
MPQDIQDLLESYDTVDTRKQAHEWERDVIRNVIKRAEPIPSTYGSDRAVCPLCKRGPQSPYDKGFTIPEGLWRHLTGEYNAHHCVVTEAAFALANDYLNDRIMAAEIAQHQAERAQREHRLRTETLYRITPDGVGQLTEHRTADSVAWAESRLIRELGFQVVEKERVKSYIRDHGDLVVWADPLSAGTIILRVYKNTKRPRRATTEMRIGDNWKHRLAAKYEELLRSVRAQHVLQRDKSSEA